MVSANLPSVDDPSRTFFVGRLRASGAPAVDAADVSVMRHELMRNAKLNTNRMKTACLFMQTPNESIKTNYRIGTTIRREVVRGQCESESSLERICEAKRTVPRSMSCQNAAR